MSVEAQCRRLARHVPLAPMLAVRPSVIPGAGRGVFATHDLKAGTKLGYYYGRAYHKYPKTNARQYHYILEITRRPPYMSRETWTQKGHPVYMDGTNILALVNGCKGDESQWNCAMSSTGAYVLTDNVPAGAEIVTNYGDEYWPSDAEEGDEEEAPEEAAAVAEGEEAVATGDGEEVAADKGGESEVCVAPAPCTL
jgi:hypothetical protein